MSSANDAYSINKLGRGGGGGGGYGYDTKLDIHLERDPSN